MKHIKLNVLQLLQLRLHPQPVCLVLELSSVMEHLKTKELWVTKAGLALKKGDEGTHHAPLRSASSFLSNPCVNKGQVRFLHLRLLYLHLQQFKFTNTAPESRQMHK